LFRVPALLLPAAALAYGSLRAFYGSRPAFIHVRWASSVAHPAPFAASGLGAVYRWVANRVPPAAPEAVAIYRVLLAAAVLAIVLTHPVDATWIAPDASGNPLTPVQQRIVSVFPRVPAVADWLGVWILAGSSRRMMTTAARTRMPAETEARRGCPAE
jgi:hypothetical protein